MSLRRVALWAVRGLGVLWLVAVLAVAWWWLTLKPLPQPGALIEPPHDDARTTYPIVLAQLTSMAPQAPHTHVPFEHPAGNAHREPA